MPKLINQKSKKRELSNFSKINTSIHAHGSGQELNERDNFCLVPFFQFLTAIRGYITNKYIYDATC